MIPPGITVFEDGTIIGKRGKPLKASPNSDGYPSFDAWGANGKWVKFAVHRVVCEAFHGPRPFPKAEVRHLNGIKTDNRASNLKWGTHAENMADKKLHGTDAAGERSGTTKLTWEQVREIRTRYVSGGPRREELAIEYGLPFGTLCALLTGKTWIDPDYIPPTHKRGEEQRDAKLTDQKVRDIRARYAAGGVTQRALGDEYGVSDVAIRNVIHRKTWKHV